MNDSRFNNLLGLVKREYKNYNECSHDWGHIQRVLQYCKQINETEQTDGIILFPACLLHDLGRMDGTEEDHSNSIKKSEKLLIRSGYTEIERKKIIDCILCHSVNSQKKPVTVEEKILFDADKLDSYGYIGVTRFFTLAGEQKWSLQESVDTAFDRITKLSDIGGFYTKEAERIGLSKVKFTLFFYYSLFKETDDEEKLQFIEKILKDKFPDDVNIYKNLYYP